MEPQLFRRIEAGPAHLTHRTRGCLILAVHRGYVGPQLLGQLEGQAADWAEGPGVAHLVPVQLGPAPGPELTPSHLTRETGFPGLALLHL